MSRRAPADVVEATLETLEREAPLRSVVAARPADELRADAAAAQARLDEGDPSPLLGIPFTVKDVIAAAGLPLTAGSRVLAQHRATRDAAAVARLRRGGALLVGKTNCPEFAFGIGCANDLYGATVNPWGAHLSPGGSSGGEAVAVAVGISALGLGTDFGGSIRWPAQCAGVLGLRPTPGRIPRTGQIVGMGPGGLDGGALYDPGSLQGLAQVPALLARSVAGLEVALAVASGPDGLDPAAAPVPLRPSDGVDLTAVTIGVCDGSRIGPVRDDVMAAVSELADDLSAAGLRVVATPDAFAGALEAYNLVRAFDDLADLRRLVAGHGEELTAGLRAILAAPEPDRADRSSAWEGALEARRAGLAQLEATPLVVLPVAPGPATGHDETLQVGGRRLAGFELMAQCRAVSLLGAPALSIPVARSSDGLPLSVQIVGPPWAEHLVLALGRFIEQRGGGWQPLPNRPREVP
jgi:amidase